jgi:hypothetical protein
MTGPVVLQPVVSMMVCVGITHPVGQEAQGLVTIWVGVAGQQALLDGSSALRGGTAVEVLLVSIKTREHRTCKEPEVFQS